MKYIDVGIQTLIFGFAAVLLATTYNEPGWPLSILYAQLLMGPWQFFSSLVSVAVRSEYHMAKRVHLFTSMAYLLILWVGANVWSVPQPVSSVFLTVPAWILAIYYYVITITWTFHQHKTHTGFLRHLNF